MKHTLTAEDIHDRLEQDVTMNRPDEFIPLFEHDEIVVRLKFSRDWFEVAHRNLLIKLERLDKIQAEAEKGCDNYYCNKRQLCDSHKTIIATCKKINGV